MADLKKLPHAVFFPNDFFNHLETPERKLIFEVLLRALKDALFPYNKANRVSAVNWFKGIIDNPRFSFVQVCEALELQEGCIKAILNEVLDEDKCKTKRKQWRTRSR